MGSLKALGIEKPKMHDFVQEKHSSHDGETLGHSLVAFSVGTYQLQPLLFGVIASELNVRPV